jgi:palmitoyltransferase
MRLNIIFKHAIPILTGRSIHQETVDQPPPSSLDVPESATLILKNYAELVSDLHYLNSLLVISRNMLAIKETAQEICAAVGFDKTVNKLIVLCVSVTSKGYDGENVDESSRVKLNEVTELCKLLPSGMPVPESC